MKNAKILILGGGISGCMMAYLLKQKGYQDISIIEKERVGGLCASDKLGGIYYEFGPHICYAENETPAFDLFHELLPEFKHIKYFPKQSMDGKMSNLATFPITVANVLNLPPDEQVRAIEELYHVNLEKPDYENFEKYIISRVGKTMYEYCYKNYNIKQWGIHPKDMDSEWAKFRNFYLRSGDFGMFGDKWQGHPVQYNTFFERLTKDINIIYDEIVEIEYENNTVERVIGNTGEYEADIYISTLPIDFVVGKKDELDYRGITKLFYLLEGESGLPTYLCTFPNNYSWTRITDYGIQAEQDVKNSLISFAIPHSAKDKTLEIEKWMTEAEEFIKNELKGIVLDKKAINHNYVYPVSSGEMLRKYDEIVGQVSAVSNLISFGRLGIYAYISMCTAVNQAAAIADDFENVVKMSAIERYAFYKKIREKLS